MQSAWAGEDEFGDVGRKVRAVLGHHLIRALHGADWRAQYRAAGVFKTLARLQQGLLADNPQAAYFLHVVVRIRDDPVPRNQLGADVTNVLDRDGIGENIAAIVRIGLVGNVLRHGLNVDLVLVGVGHGIISSVFV